ncbi:MAG: trypsin-like peptidase domain-containing protein [Anaerolineae bacterium]|nr:trypsin-like peptidase domain-containing protein [Anaerolineae bacterium]MDW8100216.1 trypsin-like peptidase domain-containing protein [Anaerolineae bacterium]
MREGRALAYWGLTLVLATLAGCAGFAPSGSSTTPTPVPTPTPQIVIIVATPTPGLPLEAVDVGEERVIAVYERVSPAVVNVTTRVLRESFFFGVYPEEGVGSGFLWDRDGHIVTNYHVVRGAQSVEVAFGDDVVRPATIVGVDPMNDLAVLRVNDVPPGVQPIELGDASKLRVGQRAIAIGNPFGQFERTLTTGVISALNRTITIDENTVLRRVIQTDAAINRGNSGGPLLDSFGRLIGVNSAIYSPTGTSAGIGLAISVDTVKRVVPELIARGRYPHPWLGVLGYTITPALARALDLPVEQGLLVARIYRDSPAARAGLRGARREVVIGNRIILAGGDILTAVDGQPIRSMDDLDAYLEEHTRVGQTVILDVIRDGQHLQLSAELEEMPSGF